ncbi:LacI family DNA-binding transcriptional regulator [Phototrophicus methaneseepsis]|uniref:LacI family DNA-binding transcriptional regulator n=1 Tax=Phototrophicus methaneseepsis TaxID=2710758 RepID=A0A7S8IC98_9CHLR|nr:LacI family DNA-binding transcriptional regulator [Phototrophicus methaneseepsis]QPC81315.1 LacI family DNA-binding transcriptional regulator [Phototrophicus methaneseepsis]
MAAKNRENPKAATIVDVAREAGVSPRTVSRVMNENGYVNPGTEERIRAAIEKLNYRPNRAARSLVSSRSRVIGLVIPDINNLFFPEVVLGIEHAATEHDYVVFTFNTSLSAEKEEEAYRFLNEHRADGMIVYFPSRLTREKLTEVLKYQRAAVLVDAEPMGDLAGVVRVDSYGAARTAVEHLVATGCRSLGYVSRQKSHFLAFKDRYRGVMETAARLGVPIVAQEYMSDDKFIVNDGHFATHKLLAEHPEIDGLICFNDMIAYGAMQACDDLGISIPDQMAIIGFDDLRLSSFPRISLTTLRLPKFEIGAEAVNLLFQRLEGSDSPQDIVIRAELIERGSTRPRKDVLP